MKNILAENMRRFNTKNIVTEISDYWKEVDKLDLADGEYTIKGSGVYKILKQDGQLSYPTSFAVEGTATIRGIGPYKSTITISNGEITDEMPGPTGILGAVGGKYLQDTRPKTGVRTEDILKTIQEYGLTEEISQALTKFNKPKKQLNEGIVGMGSLETLITKHGDQQIIGAEWKKKDGQPYAVFLKLQRTKSGDISGFVIDR